MELDCTMYENVSLGYVFDSGPYPIKIKTPDGLASLDKYGCYSSNKHAKCVIYPKGKTTWEGFQRPFKKGDIVADEHGNIAIYKGTMWYNKNLANYYCGYRKSDNHFLSEPKKDRHFGLIEELHLTTEEEKEKLFKAIKNNGYKWNEESKSLEKLPKFKVGDRIILKNNQYNIPSIRINAVIDSQYILENGGFLYIDSTDEKYVLENKFDINTLIPFESRVLVRDNDYDEWKGAFWSHLRQKADIKYDMIRGVYRQCIPYNDDTKHLLGKTNSCDEYFKNWK